MGEPTSASPQPAPQGDVPYGEVRRAATAVSLGLVVGAVLVALAGRRGRT